MVHIVRILCKNEHVRIHTRTPRSTTLHHPSVHSDTDTDQKHHKSRHVRTHLDQPRNCLFLSFAHQCMRPVESVSSKSAGFIAKDRGWPNSSVRQRVAAIKRGDPSPRYVGGSPRRLTPGPLDEIREFIEEEHGRISVKIVSNRFTLSRKHTIRHFTRRLRLCLAADGGCFAASLC